MTHWTHLTTGQYDQIGAALLVLPDTDQKANLVHILTCNFLVIDKSFDQFRFIQSCYVKNFHKYHSRSNVTSLENHLDKRFITK